MCSSSTCTGLPEEKSDLAADEEPDGGDSLQDADLVDGERRPWWQRASTWRVLLPLLVTLVAVTVGLLLQLVAPFHFYKTVSATASRGRNLSGSPSAVAQVCGSRPSVPSHLDRR